MTVLEFIFLTVTAGVLGLDVIAALQVMLSRPLVAAVIAGAILGDAAAGAAVGCVLELLWLGRLPVGAVIPPDLCLAGVVGGAGAVLLIRVMPQYPEAAGAMAILAALPAAWAGGVMESRFRRHLTRQALEIEQAVNAGDEDALGRGLMRALFWRFSLALGLAALSLGLWLPLVSRLFSVLPTTALQGLAWFYWLALLLGLMVLLDFFWDRRHLRMAAMITVLFAVLIYAFKIHAVAVLPLAALAGLWVYWKESGFRPVKDSDSNFEGRPR